jgi:hypothetical protein
MWETSGLSNGSTVVSECFACLLRRKKFPKINKKALGLEECGWILDFCAEHHVEEHT